MQNVVVNSDGAMNLLAMLPALLLTVLGMTVGLLDAFWKASRRREIGLITAVSLFGIALVSFLIQPPAAEAQLLLGGMYRYDVLTQFFVTAILVGAGITCLISLDSPTIGRMGEFYAILVVATLGGCLMAGAADLIMAFIALETLSVSLYILAGFLTNSARSAEAGIKYFLFGAFTSAVMLYGFSLLYGFTGSTNFYAIGGQIAAIFSRASDPAATLPLILAMIMILVGFGFKISAVPFHFWTPDVYEGAPTPVTAYISVASKAASFALMARFFIIVFQGNDPTRFWVQIIAILAVVTMTVGNLFALVQKNIKRLIAYSSIAQAGYALIGVAAVAGQPGSAPGAGIAALGFYMAMYILTNLAAFGVIIVVSKVKDSEMIADFAGLSRRNLGLALVLTIALLSLAGIPPAAGFFGKFFLFKAAVDSNLTWLAVVGILNAMIALYYYIIVIKVLFVDAGVDEDKPITVSPPYVWALSIATILVILLGTFLATPIFDFARRAAEGLFS
ncbi:MAG TPA: NADH-quinone oxidoreductase subunit N [Aggregatilineales bacterium]|nr:NADH-quinone oxidoreductase subunit N [Anaerolineales bacterium]HRE47146.1 NADH-quinone oxidoreductase subunit N [Aggregatilineales bacterium]